MGKKKSRKLNTQTKYLPQDTNGKRSEQENTQLTGNRREESFGQPHLKEGSMQGSQLSEREYQEQSHPRNTAPLSQFKPTSLQSNGNENIQPSREVSKGIRDVTAQHIEPKTLETRAPLTNSIKKEFPAKNPQSLNGPSKSPQFVGTHPAQGSLQKHELRQQLCQPGEQKDSSIVQLLESSGSEDKILINIEDCEGEQFEDQTQCNAQPTIMQTVGCGPYFGGAVSMHDEHGTTAGDDYYDEIEPYEGAAQTYGFGNHAAPQTSAVTVSQQQAPKQANMLFGKGAQMNRKGHGDDGQLMMQNLGVEKFVQNDEQIQSDIKFCLYCVYNNHDLSQYFKQLLRLSQRLKEWFQFTPNLLFTIFEESIKEFMHGIRDRLVDEIKAMQMITHKKLQRSYSNDDYFLIDKAFSKSYSVYGFNSEMFNHCTRYMTDSRYEQVRTDLRRQIWTEVRKNNEVMIPFSSKPEAFRKLFDTIIKYYTRVREAVIGIEEIWVFLIESVFQQELKGNLIFEQIHKQLFKKDILGQRYLQLFLKEIKDSYKALELRRSQRRQPITQKSQADAIIENLNDVLIQLEDDINYQPPSIEEFDQVNNNYGEGNGQVNNIMLQDQAADGSQLQYLEGGQYEVEVPISHDQLATDQEVLDCYEDDDLDIVTYQQLQERIREKYGGQTLAQQLDQYSQSYLASQSILRSIQSDKRCQELLQSLPNLNTEKLCYIIQNNLPPEDYERLLTTNNAQISQQQQRGSNNNSTINPGCIPYQQVPTAVTDEDDGLVIMPSKNLNFIANNQILPNNSQHQPQLFFNNQFPQYGNEYYDEDDEGDDELDEQREIERRRRKNQKKKRKRKEKKMAQMQNGDNLNQKLETQEVSQNPQQSKFLVETMNDRETSELREYIQNARLKNFLIPGSNIQESQENSDQEDAQSQEGLQADPQFEKELDLFKAKLALTSNGRKKLIPNISPSWITQLRERLKLGYNSPRNNAASKLGEAAYISGGVRVTNPEGEVDEQQRMKSDNSIQSSAQSVQHQSGRVKHHQRSA